MESFSSLVENKNSPCDDTVQSGLSGRDAERVITRPHGKKPRAVVSLNNITRVIRNNASGTDILGGLHGRS